MALPIAGQPLIETVACSQENQPPGKKAKVEEPTLFVKRLTEHAFIPARGSVGSAGYDLARYMRTASYQLISVASNTPKLQAEFLLLQCI